jgi:hypothetical protein
VEAARQASTQEAGGLCERQYTWCYIIERSFWQTGVLMARERKRARKREREREKEKKRERHTHNKAFFTLMMRERK